MRFMVNIIVLPMIVTGSVYLLWHSFEKVLRDDYQQIGARLKLWLGLVIF